MPTRQESLLLYVPAVLIILAITVLSCWRDEMALRNQPQSGTAVLLKP
jgi:hypothetical protein